MYYEDNKAKDLKIAYIGGGSRGWAWNLMSDLALESSLEGTVYLYDIDKKSAKNNEIIGNSICKFYPEYNNFKYVATETAEEALTGADFVVMSILPGTFDEMESDVHLPERHGIYQSVGDTVGLGGIVRALRTLPIYEGYAKLIEKCCPEAWVINYTNPMTVCIDVLYRTFPKIKAFGCCHEVFGTQEVIVDALKEAGITDAERDDIKVNVTGVNHFTWITGATYKNKDIFPIYREFCEKYKQTGHSREKDADKSWINRFFKGTQRVKMDLFLRYGYIAAAGDRHLAEFCPGAWYLKNPQQVDDWGFSLTPVSWRKERTKELMAQSEKMVTGEQKFEINPSGEKGVAQIKALLGLEDLITNVNIPNQGQIPNLPIGAVVETNAYFTGNSVTPMFAGPLPKEILGLTGRIVANQLLVVDAVVAKDLELAFKAFVNDPQNSLDMETARKLFNDMIENTKKYLTMYNI